MVVKFECWSGLTITDHRGQNPDFPLIVLLAIHQGVGIGTRKVSLMA